MLSAQYLDRYSRWDEGMGGGSISSSKDVVIVSDWLTRQQIFGVIGLTAFGPAAVFMLAGFFQGRNVDVVAFLIVSAVFVIFLGICRYPWIVALNTVISLNDSGSISILRRKKILRIDFDDLQRIKIKHASTNSVLSVIDPLVQLWELEIHTHQYGVYQFASLLSSESDYRSTREVRDWCEEHDVAFAADLF